MMAQNLQINVTYYINKRKDINYMIIAIDAGKAFPKTKHLFMVILTEWVRNEHISAYKDTS